MAKLAVGHPFDTIKVRLQTSANPQFHGPVDCVLKTFRYEGLRGFFKGASPPLMGWMAMDSVMLGSLTLYRRLLKEQLHTTDLSPAGHGLAGIMAGCTVSCVAAPFEHIKARLQIQYQAAKVDRLYKGPIDCVLKIFRARGLPGIYHGFTATVIFRSFFFFWWSSYDILTRFIRDKTQMSTIAINFWAGGLSAQLFWLTSYPTDVIKQRIMTDPLNGRLHDGHPRFGSWWQAAKAVKIENGWKGYWRGFAPCFLRAFPANAVALVAFEGIMRALPQ